MSFVSLVFVLAGGHRVFSLGLCVNVVGKRNTWLNGLHSSCPTFGEKPSMSHPLIFPSWWQRGEHQVMRIHPFTHNWSEPWEHGAGNGRH